MINRVNRYYVKQNIFDGLVWEWTTTTYIYPSGQNRNWTCMSTCADLTTGILARNYLHLSIHTYVHWESAYYKIAKGSNDGCSLGFSYATNGHDMRCIASPLAIYMHHNPRNTTRCMTLWATDKRPQAHIQRNVHSLRNVWSAVSAND